MLVKPLENDQEGSISYSMARKALGQHFLVDRGVLHRIIAAADLSPQDTVVEVGPGQGILTRELLKRAGRVIAVEIDPSLADSLASKLKFPFNLTVLPADARTVGLDKALGPNANYKVVANLPYYAANPIIRRFLEAAHKPILMVVTVQKEVAQAMVAPPGRMRLLAVGVQFYGTPRILCTVPPRAFRPQPKVSSAVVRVDLLLSPPVEVDSVAGFFALVQAGFSAPRKQLRNSLALGLRLSPGEVDGYFDLSALDPQRRPATLSLEEWARLYRAYRKGTGGGDKSLR